MDRYVTVGLSVLAGVALFEVALVPGVVIGGAAVLAPRYLPGLRRLLAFGSAARRIAPPAARAGWQGATLPAAVPSGLDIKKSLLKTVTFRIIVRTLDFTTNYVVIGELATAAGLSTFALVAGPVFYFVHETVWNYYLDPSRTSVYLPAIAPLARSSGGRPAQFAISRPLAKTITFRTFATVMDFTTNYVVVGDLAIAAGLSAFGFVIGPFVYLGHEMAWDYYASPKTRTADAPPLNLNSLPVLAGAGPS
jgi:uncharacterized membrane protein